jgi:hypothetical protein
MTRLMAVLLATFVAAEAVACSCFTGGTVEAAFQGADVVFAGFVVSIEDPPGDGVRRAAGEPWGPEYGLEVTFRVMQWWKTDSYTEESLALWTGYGGGDCGYQVEKGQSYLVFAARDSHSQLAFGICGRTAALICAGEDVEALGEPIKTHDTFDRDSLIAREQPYPAYGRPCLREPLLIGERGLAMDRHCRFQVEGVITREGTVRDFRIVSVGLPEICPDSLRRLVADRVAGWRFRPAELHGEPVEARLERVSMREPVTEAEYAEREREHAEWEAKQKP